MPKKVDEIHDALINDPKFYPEKSEKEQESLAWAIAWSNYNKTKKKKKNKKSNIENSKIVSGSENLIENKVVYNFNKLSQKKNLRIENYKKYLNQIAEDLNDTSTSNQILSNSKKDPYLTKFDKAIIFSLIEIKKNRWPEEKLTELISKILSPSLDQNEESIQEKANIINNTLGLIDTAIFASEANNLRQLAPALAEKVSKLIKTNPSAVRSTVNLLSNLEKLVPPAKNLLAFAKVGTPVLVLTSLFLDRQNIAKYLALSATGDFESKVWNDPKERAEFIKIFTGVIGGITMFFPVLAPLTAILWSVSSGIGAGTWAFEKGLEYTGTKAVDEIKEKMASEAALSVDDFAESFGASKRAIYLARKINNFMDWYIQNRFEKTKRLLTWPEIINTPELLKDYNFREVVGKEKAVNDIDQAQNEKDYADLQTIYLKWLKNLKS